MLSYFVCGQGLYEFTNPETREHKRRQHSNSLCIRISILILRSCIEVYRLVYSKCRTLLMQPRETWLQFAPTRSG
jgi:hypothetical protein